MPLWFFAALFATFLWAFVILIDDNLLKNVYRSARFGAVISGLFGFVPSFYLFMTNENLIFKPAVVVPAIASGVLTIIFYYFYFRTLQTDEPSVAVALLSLAPAIVPFLAFIFLGEVLHLSQYIGLGLILFMAFILSIIDARKLKFSKAVPFAVVGSISYAAVSILAKYAYKQADFRTVYVWVAFGFGVGGLIFLILGKNRNKEFKKVIKKAPILLLLILMGAELINIAAEFSQGFAISNGPVSLVRGIEGTQPIFVLLIGVLLQPFFPKNFRETKDKRFTKKLLCMAGMLVGLILIQH